MRPAFILLCACGLLSACGGNEAKSPATPSPVAPAPAEPAPAPTYSVTGTVVDGDGKPVEGASVFVGPSDFRSRLPSFSTTTDAQGRFSGTLTKTSGLILSVRKPGYESVLVTGVSISGDTVLNATLRVGVQISGTVTELGVGFLNDVTIEAVSGPSAGLSTMSSAPVGGYSLQHLLPGEYTLRASKTGYDPVEQTVHAATDVSLNFSLKWAYGTCLQSVTPTTIDFYRSAGGTERVTVQANAGRLWTVTADPWIDIQSASTITGPGIVVFGVRANDSPFQSRRGAIMIRCSADVGQNVWITQNASCPVRLEAAPDSPAIFAPTGGEGHLLLHVGTPNCAWSFRSQVDWIHTSGVSGWSGDLDIGVFFNVSPNGTGMERVGTVVVGETEWQVRQR